MEDSLDRIKESKLYEHADVWAGGAVGGTFQAMERYPNTFEEISGYSIEVPAALFEEEINSWNGDKLIHTTASYSLSRGVMKATDRVLDEPSIYTKVGVSFTAVTVLGGWKELEFDNYPDPLDMAANYTGWAMAVGHEYRSQQSDLVDQEEDLELEEASQVLESDD